MFQIWFLDSKGNILDVRAWIVTNRFCWIRLHFTRRGGDKRKTIWRNGVEENDYFKYFRQTGAINLGAAIIRGNTVHCEARLTFPEFILILALVEKKNKKNKPLYNFYCADTVSERWKTFGCSILWHRASALLPSIAIKIMEGLGIFQQQKKVKKLTVMIKKMILMTMVYFSAWSNNFNIF